ncbi:hypothetical protein M426DRAFT_94840 [Hypoxylon sp. CI-4A]|nr:hypothetical protein M426DRAFT_94840 [Hypoxylon sp. CI-4A]
MSPPSQHDIINWNWDNERLQVRLPDLHSMPLLARSWVNVGFDSSKPREPERGVCILESSDLRSRIRCRIKKPVAGKEAEEIDVVGQLSKPGAEPRKPAKQKTGHSVIWGPDLQRLHGNRRARYCRLGKDNANILRPIIRVETSRELNFCGVNMRLSFAKMLLKIEPHTIGPTNIGRPTSVDEPTNVSKLYLGVEKWDQIG